MGRPDAGERDRKQATQRYAALVAEADSNEAPLWQAGLRQQVLLGDEEFVARMHAPAAPRRRSAVDIPKAQRKFPCTLQNCLKRFADRTDALRMAYRECGMTMTAMANELGLSVSHVSRLIAAAERDD